MVWLAMVFFKELCIKILETGLSSPGPLPCACLIREGRPHGHGGKDVAVNNQKISSGSLRSEKE